MISKEFIIWLLIKYCFIFIIIIKTQNWSVKFAYHYLDISKTLTSKKECQTFNTLSNKRASSSSASSKIFLTTRAHLSPMISAKLKNMQSKFTHKIIYGSNSRWRSKKANCKKIYKIARITRAKVVKNVKTPLSSLSSLQIIMQDK